MFSPVSVSWFSCGQDYAKNYKTDFHQTLWRDRAGAKIPSNHGADVE